LGQADLEADMATEAKTKSAALDRKAWAAGVDLARQAEAERLLVLFSEVTGWEPRLWGPSMVGFGRYEYRYDSGHSGESLVVGFSPRKAELSLYGLIAGTEGLLAKLGPHRVGKGCLYVKKLAAVDEGVLREMIRGGIADTKARWPVYPV
jgi:Domain of unknown function (DU1801)